LISRVPKLIAGVVLLSLPGCAEFLKDRTDPVTTSLEFPAREIKLLVRGVDSMYDASTFGQLIYTINDNQQLLVRYEKLKTYFQSISTDSGKKVEFQISLAKDTTEDVSRVKLCPVTRNWTMHATWQNAHPFGGDGRWSKEGGDYSAADCVSPVKDGVRLKYDMTTWYVNFARGQSQNLGLLLVSPVTIQIAGEKDPTAAPRIFFQKWVN